MTEVRQFIRKLEVLNSLSDNFKKNIIEKIIAQSPSNKRLLKLRNKMFEDIDWRTKLVQNIGGYHHPMIVNGKAFQSYDNQDNDPVYVHMDFIKPGKHVYRVQQGHTSFLHQTIVRNREEELVPF